MDDDDPVLTDSTSSGRAAEREFRPDSIWRRLSIHAAALGVVLLVLIPFFNSSAPAFPDEGLYSAQAAALASGSWWVERPAADIDDDGTASAMVEPSAVEGSRVIPYSRRPAYPLLLVPLFAVGGTAGLLAISVLGTWTAAVSSALLARRINRSFAIPALWLIGLFSPLLFSAYLVMGHSVAAGLAGLVLVGAAAVADDGSRRWIAPTALAAAALVLVRSEGTILIIAVCLALVVTSVRRNPWRLRRRPVAVAVGLAAVAAGAFVLNGILARSVSAGLIGETGSVVDETGPLTAAWTDLLRPWFGTGTTATPSLPLVVLTCVLAAVCLRVLPRRAVLPIGLLWLAAIATLVRHFEEFDLVTGMVPAFPIVAALLLLQFRDLTNPPVARLALVSAAATTGLLLTVYASEDAPQWGGRFFQVILPALGPLIILGLDRGRSALSPREGIAAGAALVVMCSSLSVFALRMNHDARAYTSMVVEESLEFAQPADASGPLVVVARTAPDGVSRNFWRSWEDGEQILSTPNFRVLLEVLARTDRSDRDEVVVVSDLPPAAFDQATRRTLDDLGWEVTDRALILPTTFSATRLRRID